MTANVELNLRGEGWGDIDAALRDLGYVRASERVTRPPPAAPAPQEVSDETQATFGDGPDAGEDKPAAPPAVKEPKPRATRGKKADAAPPRAPEPSPADAAQDAADEAAEAAAAEPAAPTAQAAAPLTFDDLRQAIGEYAKRYGLAATTADKVAITNGALGAPPNGAATWREEVVLGAPNSAELIEKAVNAWRQALTDNPLNRQVVG